MTSAIMSSSHINSGHDHHHAIADKDGPTTTTAGSSSSTANKITTTSTTPINPTTRLLLPYVRQALQLLLETRHPNPLLFLHLYFKLTSVINGGGICEAYRCFAFRKLYAEGSDCFGGGRTSTGSASSAAQLPSSSSSSDLFLQTADPQQGGITSRTTTKLDELIYDAYVRLCSTSTAMLHSVMHISGTNTSNPNQEQLQMLQNVEPEKLDVKLLINLLLDNVPATLKPKQQLLQKLQNTEVTIPFRLFADLLHSVFELLKFHHEATRLWGLGVVNGRGGKNEVDGAMNVEGDEKQDAGGAAAAAGGAPEKRLVEDILAAEPGFPSSVTSPTQAAKRPEADEAPEQSQDEQTEQQGREPMPAIQTSTTTRLPSKTAVRICTQKLFDSEQNYYDIEMKKRQKTSFVGSIMITKTNIDYRNLEELVVPVKGLVCFGDFCGILWEACVLESQVQQTQTT
ncbi:unnamed protein product [Amoebophrya sp. A120]|nr:unnamed protein product [Amoebophrya sp. A120]|eukprot:GSA120T00015857001.1